MESLLQDMYEANQRYGEQMEVRFRDPVICRVDRLASGAPNAWHAKQDPSNRCICTLHLFLETGGLST